MKLSFNKKAKQRIISFTTAFAIMANAVPLGGLSDRVLPLVSLNAKAVDAVDEVTTDELTQVNALKLDAEQYTVTKQSSEFENNNDYVRYNSDTNNYSITFPNITWFLDYCWHYKYTDGFADRHKNDELDLSLTNDESGVRGTIPNTYEGLGTPSIPFDGTVKFSGNESFTIKAHRAFFGAVTDSVQLQSDATNQKIELILVRLSDVPDRESLPLLADQVVHNGGTADWKVTLSSASSNSYSGVIGEIESGASVKLDYTNESSANLASVSSVGEICGTMKDGSSIELTYSATSAHSITSSGGNAGGLVGTMIDNASLTVKTMPSVSLSAESTSAYAGGLVGELTSQATITNQTGSAIPVSGSITSDAGAGGLFGHYTNSETEFDLIDYNNTATVDGQFCGGVFGVLENSTALTVKNTGAGTLTVNSGTTGNTDGYFGGIAGKYTTNALSNSLVFDGLTLTATANATYSAFGGAIGIVDPAAYVQTTGTMSVTASGTTKANYFGGLVGATSADRGVFVDLENFTLNTGSENFKGGGVVGLFNNGVLRLSGTTTMTNAKPASATNCGQLVGDNNNVLTYAASGWTFNRSNGAMTDDLGTWGEVVRVAESDIVTVDSTAHTVTLKVAETSMESAADFAKTALNIQLNQDRGYDCLLFTPGSANTRDTLLASTALSLSSDISLAGTGITGFMRDGGAVNSIGSFTGTFNGNNHTLTLAIGEKYGNGVNASTNSEGVGQIYRHQHNGLFSVLAGTVQNLTVDGTINVSNCVDGMNIGGIASRNNGNITLTNVIAKETVNYNESAKVSVSGEGKNIGGYIGFVGTKGTITINGVSSIGAAFNLKGSHESWNVYGGAIGKITASEFTVNIGTKGDNANKLTNSLTTDISDITNVGANSDSGGLIGYITSAGSYGSRTVNINNVEFSSCTVGNAASTNGGGFLGYAWLNTTTNVNGVTVTNGTINNTANNKTAGNVGVMLYNSTGKMKVDSLSINGLIMSAGGGASLGMIVNKAYDGDNGLYLDVLNAGYDLTGTTAPAQATGIFDEIAAYSASSVINGGKGTGVISINMNADRTINNASFKTTGTYQNRLKTGNDCANSRSRYYYNVDKMSSSDDGQDLVLWSLNKYAAPNISGEFSPSSSPLAGNANLAGLSFYPLASANDNYSIGDLTLTFDYSGIYGTAESTFGTANPTDSYNRDPAVSTNQHYLMHSGLFIDQPSGKSLSVTGKLSLGGTFMEDGTHQGVLISGTENGNFTVNDNGLIELDGIKPLKGASAYKTGYLLINNITRASDLVAAPVLTIRNVYTTKEYSDSTYVGGHTNETVAKSLLGAASGKGLNIVFSHIKLDARSLTDNAVKTDVALEALYNAYGTYNSIFTDSTLLASINTDQAATLVYNYTYAEDWGTGTPRYVTYGKEVSASVENAGKQKKYYGDVRNFTNPRSNANEAYDFSTGFLKYVAAAYNDTQTDGQFSRELKVNVMVEGLTEGCGTYNDPYIITSANQLVALSNLLQTTGANSDMSTLNLPKAASDFDSIEKNTTGARWCTDKSETGFHAEYKTETNGTGYESAENGASKWTIENVKYYLANAYYVVNADVALDNTFVGLGGKSANLAFRGVIIGGDVADKVEEGEEQTYHKAVITNNSSNPFINVSNGCVVKDINIEVGSDISLEQNKNAPNGNNHAAFGYDSQCKYYGGIIGEIMGGDNIIDNSYVKFASDKKVTLTGTNGSGTIVPVGGYVGVVVFGGLIFKNMDALKTTVSKTGLNVIYTGKTENLADNDKPEDWAAIYVNPIVGRVINGYAVNETGGNALNADGDPVQQFSVTEDGKYHDEGRTPGRSGNQHTLKNGTKHYSIADIDPSLGKLDVASVPVDTSNDGTINVPNAQALFVLSLITQSTAGTAAEINGTAIPQSDTGEVETSRTEDGEGNVTIEKEKTIVNTLPAKEYTNSLSYGTYSDSVYGMSHNADYSDVGTNSAFTDITDYSELASIDTAASSAIPYIIRHYTVGSSGTTTTTTTSTKTVEASAEGRAELFEGGLNDLDGKILYITADDNGKTYCLTSTEKSVTGQNLTAGLTAVSADIGTVASGATKLLVTKITEGTNAGKFTIKDISTNKYVSFKNGNRNLYMDNNPYYFTITSAGNNKWYIEGNFSSNQYLALRNKDHFCGQGRSSIVFYQYFDAVTTTTTTKTTTNTTTTSISYPARCVTSTLGYYDINLTGSGTYQLPDSYRGLGSVGYFDNTSDAKMQNTDYSSRQNNRYCMKVDTFNGNNITIDEDIYLNRYVTDNYFSKLHNSNNATQAVQSNLADYSVNTNTAFNGIGLFDSIVMKDANSKLDNFNLSGSINTAIFSNTYSASSQEQTGADNRYMWHAVAGVVGSSINGTRVNFSRIALNNFSVRGSSYIGGLLGHSGNKSTQIYIIIDRCSATGLKLDLAATDNNEKYRDALGGFVGKVKEGGIKIYGTADGDHSTTGAYSTVELSSVLCVNSNRAGAGGLVGYAGNGCEAYDMHVDAAEGCEVTIGGSSVSMVGGIVGSMQPAESKYSSCEAIFSNCEINGINLAADEYAGGLYGGAHNNDWSPYSIKVVNCRVTGNSSNPNSITAVSYAGGLIGDAYIVSVAEEGHANVEVSDTIVSHYIISTTGNNTAAGGFIGYADAYVGLEKNGDLEQYANNSVICYIHDSSVENCQIAVNGNYGGGALGKINKHNSNKVLGYNIKLDNVTSTSSSMGAWIGWVDTSDSTTSIQFTGVGIYGNGFTKNVGNNVTFSNASFVFAAYDEDMLTANPGVSGLNKGTTVDMPRYPYVNINPQSSMGTGEVISGDGAVLYGESISGYSGKTGDKTMAAKIYADLSDSSNTRRYTTFGDEVIFNNKKINDYLKADPGADGDRISTYGTEKGTLPNGVSDFPVIVIANQTNEETTNLINRYIQLVTNTSTNYTESSDYYEIVTKACVYNNQTKKFEIKDDGASISYTPTPENAQGQSVAFSVNKNKEDSYETDKFTLIDVQFKDPLNTDKIAYHLYVPVYTIKQMEVDFYSAVKTGSGSVSYTEGTPSNEYSSLMDTTENQTHIDSLETWVTQYIRFTYNYGDLNALLQGGNLDWNHEKYVNFDTQQAGGNTEARLPDGTFMVLIDPNGNGDKEYYAHAEDFDTYNNSDGKACWKIDLNKFKDGAENFKVQDLKAVIARYINYSKNNDNTGLYKDVTELVEATPTTKYDVYRIDNSNKVHYYKYTPEGNGDSDLSINENVNEDYYISMYVPKEADYNNELYYYTIYSPTELTGRKTATVNRKNTYNVLVADLYTQNTMNRMSVAPEDQQVNATNKKISVEASTSITINNVNARSHLVGKNLYHSFDLTLNRYTESGVYNDIIGLGDSENTGNITATYSIGSKADENSNSVLKKDLQTNYLNIETANIMSDLITASNNGQPLVVSSYIEMDFDENKLEAEFPEKSSENTIGVNVSATSNLAYDESRLAYTSMSVPFASDGHYYYRESVNAAKLDYTSVTEPDAFDKIGKVSKNQSRLGINGYSPDCYQNEYMLINTEAKYNVSAISETDLAKAERLKLTISLSKKTDKYEDGTVTGVEYAQILNLLNYLDDKVLITSGSEYGTGGNGATHTIDENSSSLVVEIPIGECEKEDNIYSIGIGFKAKTGVNFHEYANYMVTLRTELVYTDDNNQEKVVENSSISDYVIYTNAKIFPTLID